jgi:hypothetical protein
MTTESLQVLSQWVDAHPLLFLLIVLWSFLWKGIALWRSAELQHRYWFIAILIINSLGILEIAYLYFIARKYEVEVIETE